MFWSAKVSRCLADLDVVGHRRQRGLGELGAQAGQRLLRRADAGGEVDHLLGQRVQPARGVDHQVAQLLERVALGVQLAVGLGRRDDHPGQQVAPLLRRLGDGVVENLAHVERLRQRRLRVGHGAAERFGLGGAELLDGQAPTRCRWCAPRCRHPPRSASTGRRARRSVPTPARWGRSDPPVWRPRPRLRGACGAGAASTATAAAPRGPGPPTRSADPAPKCRCR